MFFVWDYPNFVLKVINITTKSDMDKNKLTDFYINH